MPAVALSFLARPFMRKEVLPEEMGTRAVVIGAYRLLKALTAGCARMQSELASQVADLPRSSMISHELPWSPLSSHDLP